MALFRKPLADLSDERLMELVVRGEEQAFTVLFDRWKNRALAYFHRMLWQDRELARDQVQELFLKLARDPRCYDPSRPFSTWLYSVANNMCKNAYRHEEVKRKARPHLQATEHSIPATEGDGVDRERFRDRLREELDHLDPDQRATFVMRYHEDMPIKEIAQAFGISEGTVKSRLFYTLKKLAERMKEFDPRLMQHHGTTRDIRP